jgi:hypothetical protein
MFHYVPLQHCPRLEAQTSRSKLTALKALQYSSFHNSFCCYYDMAYQMTIRTDSYPNQEATNYMAEFVQNQSTVLVCAFNLLSKTCSAFTCLITSSSDQIWQYPHLRLMLFTLTSTLPNLSVYAKNERQIHNTFRLGTHTTFFNTTWSTHRSKR